MTELLHSSQKICHKVIAEAAKGITGAAYEIMASNNDFYRQHPNQKAFIRKYWTQFVGHARAALAVMLTDPTVSDALKEPVYEALCAEGVNKHLPGPSVPTAAELIRYGGLN